MKHCTYHHECHENDGDGDFVQNERIAVQPHVKVLGAASIFALASEKAVLGGKSGGKDWYGRDS
eukprot:618129-Ditylum_brightwellii.AAC.1